MDGGRVLRAFLASKTSYERATLIAARCGQAVAIVFAVIGFYVNPMLILVAGFIFMAAQGELQHVLTGAPEHRVEPSNVQFFWERNPHTGVWTASYDPRPVEKIRAVWQQRPVRS